MLGCEMAGGGSDAGEPREVELKLELDPAEAEALLAHPLLRGGPTEIQSFETTYFDTETLALREAGFSLRLRNSGPGERIQTLKAGRAGGAGLFERAEWERAVAGEEPDLGPAERDALAPVLERGARLAPVFRLRVERRTFRVDEPAFAALVTLDRGEVAAGERAEPLCEVELELVRGDAGGLFRLARALADAAPLLLGIRTKADRGFALRAGKAPKAVKARDPGLQPGSTVAEAFQTIGRAGLRHLLANELVLRGRRDPDAVHQMRVALRRMRAAITLFRPALADGERDRIKAELKWIADRLGEARDLDVALARMIRLALERHPADPDLQRLAAELEGRREAAYDRALEATRSPRFRILVLDLAQWIEAGDWLLREDAPGRAVRERPAEIFAAEVLGRRRKKVRERGRRLARLGAEARHEVRIEVKKLRYAAEFFAGLFRSDKALRRREPFLAALEELQQHLGDLNDVAVGEAMLEALSAETDAGGASRRRAAALVAEPLRERADKLIGPASDAFRAFRKARKFWV